ncbi:MAG: tyrosine--tRNA ligase [Candidatus Bathyarchaeia archaeon]
MGSTPDRFTLISRNAAEVVTQRELKKILDAGKPLKGYIGVEPSGFFHVGWMVWARKMDDMVKAGIEMTFLEATWHAWINDKLGGKLENIHKCASYLEHCLSALGIDVGRLRLIKAEEMAGDSDYWALVLRVGKQMSLARVKRAMTIMGRRESEASMDFSKLIYPAMQVSDIFYLDLDVCLGGTDQRKAHILAREVSNKLGFKKPVAVHTPLLMGLGGPRKMEVRRVREAEIIEGKMSKSRPETCIFIHDSEGEVREKIANAFCPPREVDNNPVIEINRLILFSEVGFEMEVERRRGGSLTVRSFHELAEAYREGEVHPLDLKNATATALNRMLDPIRRYFEKNAEARQLYNGLKEIEISR